MGRVLAGRPSLTEALLELPARRVCGSQSVGLREPEDVVGLRVLALRREHQTSNHDFIASSALDTFTLRARRRLLDSQNSLYRPRERQTL
jgi:hypothetical protein